MSVGDDNAAQDFNNDVDRQGDRGVYRGPDHAYPDLLVRC